MHSALRKEIEDCLRTLATPIDNGAPARAAIGCVDVVENDRNVLRYRAYWLLDGRARDYFGPVFQWPKECIQFVTDINRRSGLVGAVA